MKTPGPLASVTAKISAFEDYHQRLFGLALVVGAVLLIASGLAPDPDHRQRPGFAE
jgi:hypothetical protein